jgi:hypothetical protein
VTTHRAPRGLPVLWRTDVTAAIARRVVMHLTADSADEDDLRRRLLVQGGNLRQILFDLYDEHERQRPIAFSFFDGIS